MLRINPQVKLAIENHQPIVALESTIISHGMPYPENVKTALEVEEVIRKAGAIPATIGIIDGVAVVGMNKEEIEEFGKRQGIVKVSRRDFPYVIAHKLWGATTVAATMMVAKRAGIEVFVTGGIGGVHRHGETTFDISADLEELAKTEVTVICAGAKAILDLGLTLEYLETHGVPVYGYKTNILPAFYTRTSPFKVDAAIDSPSEMAAIIYAKRINNLAGGILLTNPVPEAYSMDPNQIETAIQKALDEADKHKIKGKDTTPFLLKKIVEITGGQSLEANIALIKNNAKLGAEVALALAKEQNK
ncbi:MAG: pseudouridine-5'-phosphate glycosidase [Bacilli bacterium]|jgi:pseudouridine-5'-phosphate glycosidase|nr:pseudouridine-5'-phosphate glycosidase [Bacilli bacterium]MCH4202184.1 pseudouridine-5'-phosphate glycosidase [Bacilli bacterium]